MFVNLRLVFTEDRSYTGGRNVWPDDVPWPRGKKGFCALSSAPFARLWAFILSHPDIKWQWLAQNWYSVKPQNSQNVEKVKASLEMKGNLSILSSIEVAEGGVDRGGDGSCWYFDTASSTV